MTRQITLFCLGLLFMCTSLIAQVDDFQRVSTVPISVGTTPLPFGWVGGMNQPQFLTADLNGDWILDLVVFDRSGGAVAPFINGGTFGTMDYTYAPEYKSIFPPDLHDWVVMIDYNGDGLQDIFTYGLSGITAYKASLATGTLAYEFVEDRLPYIGLSGNPINISSNAVEMPAFADINGDGDIDLLNFEFTGKFLEYYENQSIELTGGLDSLLFVKTDACWGKFREETNSNITLGVSCFSGGGGDDGSGDGGLKSVHAGSATVAIDINNDGDTDVVIGDTGSRFLKFLENGGSPTNATITDVDTTFPDYDSPVQIRDFVAPYFVDLDNDGLKDFIAAAYDRDAQSENQVWMYENVGTANVMVLDRQTTNFMVGDMIDIGERSYPNFVDYNNDGLQDIIIGGWGVFTPGSGGGTLSTGLTLLENTGTLEEPAFSYITDNFENVSNFLGIYPTFADMDNDGDMDMIGGDGEGDIHYFRNNAPAGSNMDLSLTQNKMIQIAGEGYVAPCTWDVDGDGLLDLIIGESSGKLYYYRNTSGTSGPLSFEMVSDFWGMVDVKELGFLDGYSAPYVTTLDDTETPYLVVASESGNIYLYTDLDQAEFTLVTDNFAGIDEGGRGGIGFGDLNDDGFLDLVIGNNRGGIGLFSQGGINPVGVETVNSAANISLYPNPAQNTVFVTLNDLKLTQAPDIQLFDIQGKNVGAKVSSTSYHQLQIDIAGLSAGIYFCEIATDAHRWVEKIIVE